MDESTRGVEVWCSGEDWCPITSTATLIGKSGTPSSSIDCSRTDRSGSTRSRRRSTASRARSSRRAGRPRGEAAREPRDRRRKARRVEYSLTELGESLEPVIVEMRDWGANTSWQRLTRIVRSREPVVRTGSSRVTPRLEFRQAGLDLVASVLQPLGENEALAEFLEALVDGVSRLLCGECLRAYADVWVSVNTPGNQRVARRGCPRAVTNLWSQASAFGNRSSLREYTCCLASANDICESTRSCSSSCCNA